MRLCSSSISLRLHDFFSPQSRLLYRILTLDSLSSELVSSSATDRPIVAYMLVTTPLWRKYTFLGDLPLTALRFTLRILAALFFPRRVTLEAIATTTTTVSDGDVAAGSRALIANTWHRYQKTREAFRHHSSQYTWDRHLYMIISRYVWFNDLRKIEPKT